jgi:hypothetical protein
VYSIKDRKISSANTLSTLVDIVTVSMPDYYDIPGIVSTEEQLSRFRQHFTLDPKQLRGLILPVDLNWQTIRFAKRNVPNVTKQPGIYAFAVAHREGGLPPHSYVLYIGQTGAKPKERTLRNGSAITSMKPKNPNGRMCTSF